MNVTIQKKFTTMHELFKQWIVDGVFGQVPRMVFGNSAGLQNNLGPRLSGAWPVRRNGQAPSPQVAALYDEGFVFVEPGYDPSMMARVIDRFNRIIHDPEHSQPNSKYSVELKDPLNSIPELGTLLNPLKRLLNEYFGSAFRIVETQAFRTYPIPESERSREAYSNFWHCDGYPVPWVKVYIFLSDWTRESGGTEILPVAQTRRVMRSGYINRYFSFLSHRRLQALNAQAARAVGRAGSAFLFNPQRCLHRAGIPRDGRYRDAMVFFVAGSDREAAAG